MPAYRRQGEKNERNPDGDIQFPCFISWNPTILWKERTTIFIHWFAIGLLSNSGPFFHWPHPIKNFCRISIIFKIIMSIDSSASLLRSRHLTVHIGIEKIHFSLLFRHAFYSTMSVPIQNPIPDVGRPVTQVNPFGPPLFKVRGWNGSEPLLPP